MNNFFKKSIKVFMFLLLLNLIWSVLDLNSSLMYYLSNLFVLDDNATISTVREQWNVRGQIGDIMSGHFSALAFLAVALSIIYQSEANQQMKKSIDKQEEALLQQSEALKVQSESLKAQIEELKESREESSKQTEQFFVNNMNVKLDRYYKLFDKQFNDIFTEQHFNQIAILIPKVLNNKIISYDENKKLETARGAVGGLLEVLDQIFKDIQSVRDIYDIAYESMIKEYALRLRTDGKTATILLLASDKHKYEFLNLGAYKKIDWNNLKVEPPIL